MCLSLIRLLHWVIRTEKRHSKTAYELIAPSTEGSSETHYPTFKSPKSWLYKTIRNYEGKFFHQLFQKWPENTNLCIGDDETLNHESLIIYYHYNNLNNIILKHKSIFSTFLLSLNSCVVGQRPF